MLAAGAAPAERVALVRLWAMAACGAFAVAVPHVLLPDPHVPMLQRLNRSPAGLLRHQMERWIPVVGLAMAPGVPLLLLGGSLAQGVALLAVVLGAALFAFAYHAAIGPTMQAWQEGRRGGWYRAMKENSPGGFAAPDGMVPALLATPRIFALALVALVAAIVLGRSAPLLSAVPGLGLLGGAFFRLARQRHTHDHAFYATNAFYAEVFRSAGGMRAAGREPVPYRAVYWVPRRWKPAVWASLRQLDRRLPLGRFVALGHGLLWLMAWADVPVRFVEGYLLFFALAKNGAVGLLASRPLAPGLFQQMLLPPRRWAATRFFVNLRWTLPFLGSLAAVALFDPVLTLPAALGWTALDLVLAFFFAALVTYAAEHRYPRRYA